MRVLILLCGLSLSACRPHEGAVASEQGGVQIPTQETVSALDQALADNTIVTAGFGILQNGELVWSHFYGEESPGVVASASTRFNAASITKQVSAEAALRLAAAGELDLDAPLAQYWIDPDIAADPRRDQLTARRVLNHTSGFPNWRFFRADHTLAFEHDPGTHYGYSGEGFEYLARAIERKLGQPFPAVVRRTVFEPIGMPDTVIAVQREGLTHVARPVDADGVFHGYYCRPDSGGCTPDGAYSAADEMLITVPDYARFLIALLHGSGYDAATTAERDRVYTDRGDERLIDCRAIPDAECPLAQGYGLGHEVAKFAHHSVLGHSGSDWSEQSLGYVYQPTGDGLIVFLNAPNARALAAMPRILDLLDPSSPFLQRYSVWLERAQAKP
jgi:CubicO group peptidase (beta-lactamase class C family)